jgi:hypothetical protein
MAAREALVAHDRDDGARPQQRPRRRVERNYGIIPYFPTRIYISLLKC